MLVRLTCVKILKVEHNDLVLGFIRAQIKRFEDFHTGTEDAVDAETVDESSINRMGGPGYTGSLGTDGAIILGSGQKMLAIEKILGDEDRGDAFTSFCSRVSHAVQALSSTSADTIAINDSHQVPCFINFTDHSFFFINIHTRQIVLRSPNIGSSR